MVDKNNSSQGKKVYKESFSSSTINGKYISVELPVDLIIWRQAHKLLDSNGVYSDEFATCIVQDPVLALEIIKGGQLDTEEISSQNEARFRICRRGYRPGRLRRMLARHLP